MTHNWANDWTGGFGVLQRDPVTHARIATLAERLVQRGVWPDAESVYRVLAAADRLTRAAMWLVVHMTYARRVDLSGAALPADAFKDDPQGHTGGSLNMVPAFVGYLAANVLSGVTRSWVMGQGHCAAAIEAVNALTGDISPRQRGRYQRSDAGLSQLASDFYGYQIRSDGRPAAPLGGHLGPTTAGAVSEGGDLGCAELQYVHIPLLSESLVAFLSDGGFEEQRGADWAPRWWRAEDCGLATPVMILNGGRLRERREIDQDGGATRLEHHLSLSGFDPMLIDGHDPAAFAWAILEAEERVKRFMADPQRRYPAPLPYVVAHAVKGFGFPGAGTHRAHDLPLGGSLRHDGAARDTFNAAAGSLFVRRRELAAAVEVLKTHEVQGRPLESRHAAAARNPPAPREPATAWTAGPSSPMDAIDAWFVDLVDANPNLRPRVGSPGELRSNHMGRTLDRLKHRVARPEAGTAEAVDGAVITALNEEAVCSAALGNKGGLNLIVSYEAFAARMQGALRQEIVFARRQKEAGTPPQWISIPLIATSHTWEDSENGQSHQDPTLSEALLGELSDTARVLFPVDANSAIAALADVYRTRGQIACLVVPKRPVPALLAGPAAAGFAGRGWAHLAGDPADADVQIVAVGAYQAVEALQAAERLQARGHRPCVTAVLEPGRLRAPRDPLEAAAALGPAELVAPFPPDLPRVLVTHTRPEPLQGLLRRIDPGPDRMVSLGYIGHGGAFDVFGMLFANRCTWGHIVEAAAKVLKVPTGDLLDPCEATAVAGKTNPRALQTSLG